MALTPKQVKDRLERQGKTQKQWAEENGFDATVVNRVLNGSWKGRRGKGHEIAVKLGLKDELVD